LQQWQNSAGTVLGYISNGGEITTRSGIALRLFRADNAQSNTITCDSSGKISIEHTGVIVAGSAGYVQATNYFASGPNLYSQSGSPVSLYAAPNGSGSFKSVVVTTSSNCTAGYLFAVQNNGSDKVVVDFNGYLGIGTTTIGAMVQINTATTTTKGLIIKAAASQSANLQEWQNSSGTALAYMDASGNFYAVSKSFLIDHPTPEKKAQGKKLHHASLEGPEHAVFFRGTLTDSDCIILPEYWKDLVHEDTVTVVLTSRKYPQPNLYVEDANNIRVLVRSDRAICCDFVVYGTRKDVPMLEVEIDGN